MSAALALALALALAGSARSPAPTPAGSPASRARAPFTVALDPGHGGTNLGTHVGSAYEKRITLDLARRVRRRLAADAGIRVILCRERDALVPIRARVRCGNESGARLFLSLHANASPDGPTRGSQRGFELYVLPAEQVEEDALVAQLAEADDAEAAWASRRVRMAAEESALAARRVEVRLAEVLGPAADRGIKQGGASLDVLRGLRMPAVLVEVGFLDHAEDGPLLTSARGLESIAAALARAVTDLRARDARGVAAMSAPIGPPPTVGPVSQPSPPVPGYRR